MKKQIAIALGMLAVSAMADITLDGPTFVTSNTTVSEKVTGSGYYVVQNGANFKLTNSGNDFTGGIIVSNGCVVAEASGAFGTGDIVFRGLKSSDPGYVDSDRYNRQVYLKAKNGTFPNNFIFHDYDVHSDFPGVRAIYSATVTGNITTPDSPRKIVISADSGATLTVTGDVTAPTLWDTAVGNIVLKGKVTSGSFQHGSGSSQNGTLELWNPENSITSFTMKMGSVECRAENVLYGAKISWSVNSWYMSGTSSQIRLNGYNQAFGGIHDDTSAQNMNRFTLTSKTASVITPDDKPATVTIIGTSASWWPTTIARFFGPVNIVGDKKESSYTCVPRFRWVASGMTGTLATSNTTFYLINGASFENASAMVAASSGTFSISAVTNALTGLRRIEVAGTVSCDASCVEPINAPKAELHLKTGAFFTVANGVTNTVRKLFVDGVVQEAGIYTKANLAQMSKSGETGVLKVLRGPGSMILVR